MPFSAHKKKQASLTRKESQTAVVDLKNIFTLERKKFSLHMHAKPSFAHRNWICKEKYGSIHEATRAIRSLLV